MDAGIFSGIGCATKRSDIVGLVLNILCMVCSMYGMLYVAMSIMFSFGSCYVGRVNVAYLVGIDMLIKLVAVTIM